MDVDRYIVQDGGKFKVLKEYEESLKYDNVLAVGIPADLAGAIDGIQSSYESLQSMLKEKWAELRELMTSGEIDQSLINEEFDEIFTQIFGDDTVRKEDEDI